MLETRSNEKEIMDDLEISGEVINHTLKELNFINRTLGGNQISIRAFKKFCQTHKIESLADLGCGGGDILVDMCKWAKKRHLGVQFTGVDANPHIVAFARENTADFPSIQYKVWNIFGEEFGKQQFDLIHCCLFTHHFTNKELIHLFKNFKTQARVGVIINDLHRHPLAYWSIKWLTRIFSKSYMVKNDAKVSVARGFKKIDLMQIMQEAGIENYRITWHWAFRWQLIF